MASAIQVADLSVRPVPCRSALNQSSARTAYSARCASFRSTMCTALSLAPDAPGTSVFRNGTTNASVWEAEKYALPRTRTSTSQNNGNAYRLGVIACQDTPHDAPLHALGLHRGPERVSGLTPAAQPPAGTAGPRDAAWSAFQKSLSVKA